MQYTTRIYTQWREELDEMTPAERKWIFDTPITAGLEDAPQELIERARRKVEQRNAIR